MNSIYAAKAIQAGLDDGGDAVNRLAESSMHTLKLKIRLEQMELLVGQRSIIVIGDKTAQQIGECEIGVLGSIVKSCGYDLCQSGDLLSG